MGVFTRVVLLSLFGVAVALRGAAFSHDGDDGAGAGWERVEKAYRAGMAAASSADERLACHELRRAALAALVERHYQAASSWLLPRAGLLSALEEDQTKWRRMIDAMPRTTPDELDRLAHLYRDRLRALEAITANADLQRTADSRVRDIQSH